MSNMVFQEWWKKEGLNATWHKEREGIAEASFNAGIARAASLSNSVAAGELPALPEAWITDYTTKDPEARLHFAADQMRAYGRACAEAARQPAPVAAQENGGLVRAALIDIMEVEPAALSGEFKQDMTFDFAKQSHYRALFARARAALAATAAPVLSQEQIDRMAVRNGLYAAMTPDDRTCKSMVKRFVTEILAATRSQP